MQVVVSGPKNRYFHLTRSLKRIGKFVGRGSRRSIAEAVCENGPCDHKLSWLWVGSSGRKFSIFVQETWFYPPFKVPSCFGEVYMGEGLVRVSESCPNATNHAIWCYCKLRHSFSTTSLCSCLYPIEAQQPSCQPCSKYSVPHSENRTSNKTGMSYLVVWV